jgi:hypothetical protein
MAPVLLWATLRSVFAALRQKPPGAANTAGLIPFSLRPPSPLPQKSSPINSILFRSLCPIKKIRESNLTKIFKGFSVTAHRILSED